LDGGIVKLFKVEFADETHIQIASHPDEAIELVREKTTIDFLPYTATEIDLGNYIIVKKNTQNVENVTENTEKITHTKKTK
jgi:hypothetical protein